MRKLGQGATLALLLLCGGSAFARLDYVDRSKNLCADGKALQLTMGVPTEYLQFSRKFGYEKPGENVRQFCTSIATGSSYQLLSWLENGAIQAAILPDFAIAVMQADSLERFRNEYYVMPVNSLPALPKLERHLLLTDGTGKPLEKPYARLDELFAALRQQPASQKILLPSHLSPAMPYLIRYAVGWAERQELKSSERELFYQALLGAIRLGKPVAPGGQAADITHQFFDEFAPVSGSVRVTQENEVEPDPELAISLSDHLVVRRRVFMVAKELRGVVDDAFNRAQGLKPITSAESDDVALFARTRNLESALGRTLTDFRESNYRRLQSGAVAQRHFRFTIPELWTLLDSLDQRVGFAPQETTRNLALVLTGGGVKAAYQTRMIDYLYDEKRLVNAGDSSRAAHSQQVDYIIGTSGGALLGVFVAAMDGEFNARRSAAQENKLTSILWREPGEGLKSFDVFPFLDMMRYATFIVALLIIWMVAAAVLAVGRRGYPQVTRLDYGDQTFFARRARAWKESWPWIALLLAAPIVIIQIANRSRVEHVPTETGLYYAWMALLVFYSDVRLRPLKAFEWTRVRFTWLPAVLAVVGAALIVVSLWRPELRLVAVNLCCLGFLVLTYALYFFFRSQTEFFALEPQRAILGSFAALVGILLAAYCCVVLAMWMDFTSLLEMNGGFWKYFALATALLTAGYLLLGRAPSANQATSWAQSTVGYLFSEYPSRAMFGSERRFMRFVSITALAWLWWNMLAAPALYGNHNARAFLEQAFDRFIAVGHPGAQKIPPAGNTQGREFPLAVPFVITATSLERGQERYFLFVSGRGEEASQSLPPDAWFNVARDPRWVVVNQPLDKELQSAAFASGSPFPVFSAHDVQLRMLPAKERLIDGGFAHNRPIEAAAVLGARKVLVLNSSPLEAQGGGECLMLSLRIGELACNLPKLLPYLWERSQVEDLLITRRMVVASIYPTTPTKPWPSLTDFRRSTVVDLVHTAEADEGRRVGVIDGWGEPQAASSGLVGYDVDQIIAAIMNEMRTG
jgi:predicted acylesterase/phospholipase RssA